MQFSKFIRIEIISYLQYSLQTVLQAALNQEISQKDIHYNIYSLLNVVVKENLLNVEEEKKNWARDNTFQCHFLFQEFKNTGILRQRVGAISKAPYEHKSAWKQVQGTRSYLSFGIKSLPLKCNLETSTFCQGNQTIFKEYIWMKTFINWSGSAILRNNWSEWRPYKKSWQGINL